MKPIIATILVMSLFPFCKYPKPKIEEYIEFKLIGLVFCDYYIDSTDHMSHFMPYPYVKIFINNKTSDTILLANDLKVQLSYFDVPLQQPRILFFPCHRQCPPLTPNRKRFQDLLNLEYAFWLESGVSEVYNDSLIYKNRCHILFSNSHLAIDFLGQTYNYKINSSDIIYVNDCTLFLGHTDKDIRERYKMDKRTRFPLEQIYIKGKR